ncbi:hypothetical protein FACS189468_6570 [Spirochaetia bacterium]|nr:hypothetical protein FACS189468_6570 [Spirochaetia bacterium]
MRRILFLFALIFAITLNGVMANEAQAGYETGTESVLAKQYIGQHSGGVDAPREVSRLLPQADFILSAAVPEAVPLGYAIHHSNILSNDVETESRRSFTLDNFLIGLSETAIHPAANERLLC